MFEHNVSEPVLTSTAILPGSKCLVLLLRIVTQDVDSYPGSHEMYLVCAPRIKASGVRG